MIVSVLMEIFVGSTYSSSPRMPDFSVPMMMSLRSKSLSASMTFHRSVKSFWFMYSSRYWSYLRMYIMSGIFPAIISLRILVLES